MPAKELIFNTFNAAVWRQLKAIDTLATAVKLSLGPRLLWAAVFMLPTLASPLHAGAQPVEPSRAAFAALPGRLAFATATPAGWSFDQLAPDGGTSPLPFWLSSPGPVPSGSPAYDMALSPQGSKLAYAAEDGVYVADADAGVRLVWSDPAWVPNQLGSLAWSPDGSEIAFVGYHSPDPSACDTGQTGCALPKSTLYVMAVDGSDLRSVADGLNQHGLAWSPDGSEIAFGENQGGIFVVGSSGGVVRTLSGTERILTWSSSWSAAGALLVEGGDSLASVGVWQVAADGTGLHSVLPGGHSPSWAPDGTHFAAVLNDRIVIANASGSVQSTIGPVGALAVRWGGGTSANPNPVPNPRAVTTPSSVSTACGQYATIQSAENYVSDQLKIQYGANSDLAWQFPDAENTWRASSTLHVLNATPSSGHATGGTGTWYFFFVDGCSVGQQAFLDNPSGSATDATTFSISYDAYRSVDSNCCPSGGKAVVPFHWDGTALTPPRAPGAGPFSP